MCAMGFVAKADTGDAQSIGTPMVIEARTIKIGVKDGTMETLADIGLGYVALAHQVSPAHKDCLGHVTCDVKHMSESTMYWHECIAFGQFFFPVSSISDAK
ncbi:uncharacterized protein MELLADRAFT_103251 [Melampsora larici-populina 98AG31]|uniref:Uncharacterized protein n=1 Tax=Melampsora larici-populina (strain 98AG31 / pathotype 3-4-7) TaxID=747676 RepID=F4RB15_MELLP|nr:uncharacterized protein MELLADRAFT_103251 [Melampsora larici-populina 98AG31]EGG10680.1 hypothetical protein MELLADRAFT_103251 [Melampsora larici-populina 98AG31]